VPHFCQHCSCQRDTNMSKYPLDFKFGYNNKIQP
jgi:hypothetical protein